MQQNIEKINFLIKEGKSLNKISSITGISKTTIYYHYRKHHGIRIKKPKINLEDKEVLGEFLGVVAGDGYVNSDKLYHHRTRIFLNITEGEYSDSLISLFSKFIGKPVHKYVHEKGHVIQLSILSREVSDLVKQYLFWKPMGHRSKSRSVYLKKYETDKNFKIGFLRGCIDTDGYINKNRIQFCTASKKLCTNIESFLKSLKIGYRTTLYQDKRPNKSLIYFVNINSKTERFKFMDIINPRNKKASMV